MYDPRLDNCKVYREDDGGKVIGVELDYVPAPSTKYQLIRAELIDEVTAQGTNVASCFVLDKNGVGTGQTVSMVWPWPHWSKTALPGNPNNQHPITNTYKPPEFGPLGLAIFSGDTLISDMIGGLGLPNGHHVSFRLTWQERGATSPDPDPLPDPDDNDGLLERLVVAAVNIEADVHRLVQHLGVGE